MAAVATSASVFLLLADNPKSQLLVAGLCLAAALLLGALVIALVHRWRQRSTLANDLSPSAQLAQFRSLYEKGAISQEEFERLRNLLGARLREDLGVPAPPAEPRPSGSDNTEPRPSGSGNAEPPPSGNGQPTAP